MNTWKRSGRRRRSRAKKARMLLHPVRTERPTWLGEEHRRIKSLRAIEAAMIGASDWVYCVDGPKRGWMPRPPNPEQFDVAELIPIGLDFFKTHPEAPVCKILTYRRVRRSLTKCFYLGRNRITIRLSDIYTVGDPKAVPIQLLKINEEIFVRYFPQQSRAK